MCDGDWKKFYEENPPPTGLLEIKAKISNFCTYHINMGNVVVLVTAGGTTVPLEHSTVRFVDNFSAGNRGAASAEYFLKSGYAVIYMHRTKSLEPFIRNVSVEELLESSTLSEKAPQEITVQGDVCNKLVPILNNYKSAIEKKMVLKIHFTTLSSYLHTLYIAAQAMRQMGSEAILYLAAAVSDFYIPEKDMSIHKISSDEALNLTLQIVPKMLQPLVRHWIPDAFVVSFKLETDKALLIKKAKGALEKYGHKLVIANELHSRREKVTFVTQNSVRDILLSNEEQQSGIEIEELIVKELIKEYDAFRDI